MLRRSVYLSALCSAFCLASVSISAQEKLTIGKAIATALQNNYDIRLAKNDSVVAALDYSYRNAGFLPRLNATAGEVWNRNNQKQEFANGTRASGRRSSNPTTSVSTTREIWWDPTATGVDEIGREDTGMWRYVEGGRRYLPGECPAEPAPFIVEEGSVTRYEELPAAEALPDYPRP